MKKSLSLILTTVFLTGCYSYVEYDYLYSPSSAGYVLDDNNFDNPIRKKIGEDLLILDIRSDYQKEESFILRLYSREFGANKLITRSVFMKSNKIISEVVHDKLLIADYEDADKSGAFYRNLILLDELDRDYALALAEAGDLQVEVFYEPEDGLEASVVFEVRKEHTKTLAPPT